MGIGAIGVDHPDLISVANVSLIDDPAAGGPGETAHAVHSARGDLDGGVGIIGRTDPKIDVRIALNGQEGA